MMDIEQRIKDAERDLPPISPKERAERDWQNAMAEAVEARRAYAQSCRTFDEHAARLKSLAVADVPAWSERLAELRVLVDGYADLLRFKEAAAEGKRLIAAQALAEPNPAIVAAKARIEALRAEMTTLKWNDPRNKEIRDEIEMLISRLPKEYVEIRDPQPKPAKLPKTIQPQ